MRLSRCSSQLWSTGSEVVAHELGRSLACGIFLDQGSNICLLYWQVDSLWLSHQRSPMSLFLLRKIKDK